jgi:ribosome-binding factor A
VSGRRHDNRGASPYPRSLRVNQVLRQVLAEELERLADADERLRLVTVTAVDTAPDLRHATVYLSSLSDDAADALAERRAHLQRSMGRQLRMKRTPLLAFDVDPGVVAGGLVEDALRRIRETEGSAEAEGSTETRGRETRGKGTRGSRDAGSSGDDSQGAEPADQPDGPNGAAPNDR